MNRFPRSYLSVWVGTITTSLVLVAILFASKMGEAGLLTGGEVDDFQFVIGLLGLMTVGLIMYGIVEGCLGLWEAVTDWWPGHPAVRYAIPLAVTVVVGFVLTPRDPSLVTGTEAVALELFAYAIGILVAQPLVEQAVQPSDIDWFRERVRGVRA